MNAAMDMNEQKKICADIMADMMPYVRNFRDAVFVVKIGGSVMEVDSQLDLIMGDIAFMRLVGMKVVVVHGGGKAISKAIFKMGREPAFVDGQRVTDGMTMEVVRKTLNNVINPHIVKRLLAQEVNARPLHGNWIFSARKITNPDRGYVGEIVSVDVRAVNEMLGAGVIPVVTPIATGIDDQHLYNVNADFAAAALAKALKVRRFVVVSDMPGLMYDLNDSTTLLSHLHISSIGKLKKSGIISGGMIPKIDSCVDVLLGGVEKVHLVDGRIAHSLLLELFTKDGVGTEILSGVRE
jgi:acetylglutamate kinase